MDEKRYLIAGIDDATKCPCIGSIFMAGVLADRKIIKYWRSIGVKDSKIIAPEKRQELAREIKNTAVFWSIKEITPQNLTGDQLNLNDLEMVTTFGILKDLGKNYVIRKVFIDNWGVNLKRLNLRFDKLGGKSVNRLPGIKIIASHKADGKYTVVGAASILAKTGSDRQYTKYRKIFGDFGSGNPADPKTRYFVWKNRKNPPGIIRTSWSTFSDISKLKNIDDDCILAKYKKKW